MKMSLLMEQVESFHTEQDLSRHFLYRRDGELWPEIKKMNIVLTLESTDTRK